MKWIRRLAFVSVAAVVAGLAACRSLESTQVSPEQAAQSQRSFKEVAKVLRHPRCLNCHTQTAFVRVGDDRRPHGMNVVRGPHNNGVPGMRCSSCHQKENQALVGVPGALHWQAAPLSMAWESMDDHDLARALLDPLKNGDRSLSDLTKHMKLDPLVLWSWDPGPGRAVPPVDHATFVRAFESWVDNGAVLPEPGQTTY